MRYRVALGVFGALAGGFIGPDVAFADDCSGLADCFGTVYSAVASLAGGALVLAGAAALSSRLGGGRLRPGTPAERAGRAAAKGAGSAADRSAAEGAARPSEAGSRPVDREPTTPPGRIDTTLHPPDGGPTERYTDMTTKDGDIIHMETKPDGSMSGALERPDRTTIEADRRPDGSTTERHYDPAGDLVGTREIAPDKSSTFATPPVTHPDGSVSVDKTDVGPDGRIISHETSTAFRDGTTSVKTTNPDGTSLSQTNYPGGRTSTTVAQPDGTTTERHFDSDGRVVTETTTTPAGSSHLDKL